MRPAFIKRADVAWFASHHHTAAGSMSRISIRTCSFIAIDLPARHDTDASEQR